MGRRAVTVVAALALAGCTTAGFAPVPQARSAPPPLIAGPVAPETPASAEARDYYAQVQSALLGQGLLRSDGGGPDTPFTDRMLAENFLRIALYDEFTTGSGGLVAGAGARELRRWEAPVRISLRFGSSVAADRRATDTARISSYLDRLTQVTGRSIRLDDSNPNFFLYVVSEDERRAMGPAVASAMPEFKASDVAALTEMPRSTYCMVLAQSTDHVGVYTRAVAVVRAELPDLLRLSCLHEELAQGLGLANDSPRARPSIFNDDEEFALLTRMDEQMLRMLYSPALGPGMTGVEVRPIVESLARRMTGGAT